MWNNINDFLSTTKIMKDNIEATQEKKTFTSVIGSKWLKWIVQQKGICRAVSVYLGKSNPV